MSNLALTLVDLSKWRRALYSADLTPTAAKVGAYLSDHIHSKFGYAWTKIRTIAAETRVSLATVKRAIRELRRAGLVLIESGVGWLSSRYRCILPSGVAADTTVVSAATPPCKEERIIEDLSPSDDEAVESADFDSNQVESSILDDNTTPEKPVETIPEPTPTVDLTDDNEAVQAVLAAINEKSGKNFTEASAKPVRDALKRFSVTELVGVVWLCAASWSSKQFLTPSAILNASKLAERVEASANQARHGQGPKLRLPAWFVEANKEPDEDMAAADSRLLFMVRTGRMSAPAKAA